MATKSLTHAGCVVFRDDKEKIQYLIASSSNGEHWILPQGHIDPGETPEATALRELEEETGVVGEIIRPLLVQEFDKGNEKVVVQYYLVRMIGMKPPMENREIYWKDKASAFELLSFKEAKNTLNVAFINSK
jgi:8-oxo-dGTP pyrophosphatase MutT (NUDIX family)